MSSEFAHEAGRRDVFTMFMILLVVAVCSFVVGCKIGHRHGAATSATSGGDK